MQSEKPESVDSASNSSGSGLHLRIDSDEEVDPRKVIANLESSLNLPQRKERAGSLTLSTKERDFTITPVDHGRVQLRS